MFQKKIRTKIALIICISLTINILQAQSRFKGGIVGGFNAAQLNGDASAGYNKVGLNAGIRGLIELGGRLELSTEILYSQRGSRTTEREAVITRSCTLNYLEVPVLLNIRDWLRKPKNEGDAYYKAAFSIGLAYGRLFKVTSNIPFTHAALLDKFNQTDVSFMMGLNYFINAHWSVDCRYATSINKLFNPKKYPTEPLAANSLPLRGHYLSFQTAWIF